MKFLALLALATGLAITAHAQAVKPKAKDNLILIQTPDSAATALRKLAQVEDEVGLAYLPKRV